MAELTCTAILRAKTGPCSICHGDRAKHNALGQSRNGTRRHIYLGPRLGICGRARGEHPDEGMVRFEWAETARPNGLWYYRRADLAEPSVLRRDHAFTTEALAEGR